MQQGCFHSVVLTTINVMLPWKHVHPLEMQHIHYKYFFGMWKVRGCNELEQVLAVLISKPCPAFNIVTMMKS